MVVLLGLKVFNSDNFFYLFLAVEMYFIENQIENNQFSNYN